MTVYLSWFLLLVVSSYEVLNWVFCFAWGFFGWIFFWLGDGGGGFSSAFAAISLLIIVLVLVLKLILQIQFLLSWPVSKQRWPETPPKYMHCLVFCNHLALSYFLISCRSEESVILPLVIQVLWRTTLASFPGRIAWASFASASNCELNTWELLDLIV